jgi:uncharacterized membrane protein
MIKSRRKSILETVGYRAILTLVLAIITFAFTGGLVETSGITIIFSVFATIIYYIHERIWAKVTLT